MTRAGILLVLLLLSACGGGNNAPSPNSASQSTVAGAQNQPAQPEKPKVPEPEPLPQPEPSKPPQTLEQQRQSDYVSFVGGVRAWPAERRVEVDCFLLSEQTRPLEFLLVAAGGAVHESLLVTGAKGEHIKRALELILLKEGEEKRYGRGYLDAPTGDRVKLSVRFKHETTGKDTTVAIEDWLTDITLQGSPERVGFIFTGSYEQFRPEMNRSLFEADLKGNLIGLWRDASCVLDNDRKNGINPDVYSPNPNADGIPRADRIQSPAVTLILEPWK